MTESRVTVLFVNHTVRFDAGGGERVLHDLLRGMNERFRVLLAVPQEEALDLQLFRGVVAELFPLASLVPGGRDSGRRILGTAWSLLRLNLQMLRLLMTNPVDLLYVNSIYALHFSALPAALLGKPLIYHEHNLASQRRRSLWHLAFRPLLKLTGRAVAIAGAVRDELVEAGMERERITVVHNWVAEWGGAASGGGAPGFDSQGHYCLGQIANLLRWKGHDTVLRALPLMLAAVPHLRFFVFGRLSDENYLADLRKLCSQLGVEEQVTFLGFRDDIRVVLPTLDCLVLASDREPFGLVLVEAMLAGVPVVASDAGGVPEIVRDGVDGLLFPPGDYQALAERVIALARDQELTLRLTAAAKQRAAESFSMAGQIGKIVAVVEQVAQQAPRSGLAGQGPR
jgi:glycosyltransferase involved in cell wall biosynthesis